MAVAVDRNVPDFSHLFAQGELAGIQAACSLSPSSPSPANSVELQPEHAHRAGQNAPEPAKNNEFSVAASALAATEQAATALEGASLAASAPAVSAAPSFSDYANPNDKFDAPLLNMVASLFDGNKFQCQNCSPENLGALASQKVGTSQRGQSTGHSVA